MAEAQNSIADTVPQDKSDETKRSNHKLAIECRGWEGDLSDLRNMAAVGANVISDAFGSRDTHYEITGRKECYAITDGHVDQMLFCIFHLERMIGSFVERYYTAIEAR